MSDKPILAVIGGSGLYQMPGLADTKTIKLDTPFGQPSSPIIIGTLSGKRVAFLSRHGIGHSISPTELNNRANIYALKSLGATRIVTTSACGSLRDDFSPGHIVIPDQLIDFTKDRVRTFFRDGIVGHVSVADPYCSTLAGQLHEAVKSTGATAHAGGTFITIEGPRFSTRAESNLFRSWGMSIIGMTACPETFLAREAEMCYATMALVTDYDVWHISEEPVTVEIVMKTMAQNTSVAQDAIKYLVENLDEIHTCDGLMAHAIMTGKDHMPEETRQKLGLLIEKYL